MSKLNYDRLLRIRAHVISKLDSLKRSEMYDVETREVYSYHGMLDEFAQTEFDVEEFRVPLGVTFHGGRYLRRATVIEKMGAFLIYLESLLQSPPDVQKRVAGFHKNL